ncbi:hypothetical protein ERO13_A11G285700v2 [Gossypium hirsutum]|uniref:Uncharacterized protein n=1 Tax=Gossypium darwinii TaxID=34276 RepID=A0A5D2ES03_GOSDA|nr:hypothetical protein ERO13_A11G285700v2 [Gossypium hirsutum]TYG96290.1 hypothetical protein ES288_A11G338000v1 [Gossypium darwinii]
MSSPISTNLVPSQHSNTSKENRHLSKFKPSFWGDIFLSSPSQMQMDAGTQQEYEELKQEVRRMLVANMDKSSQKLHIIDAVQRLGVPYHFEKEIEEALEIIYHHHCNHIEIDGDDLYTTAVRFRLLREHGFDVDCATFNKFKDENGNFKESLIGDVKGMLELYEAAHFQLHGENILEEALSFTTFHLKWWKDLDVATNFPFIRDRFVECYFWMLGVYFEPHYAIARTFVTKVICLISILDDIYDAYGTYEELEIFTKAIQRWDTNCIDQLPDYMKLWYSETLKVYKDMEDLMSKEGKSYRVQVAIEAMKRQSQVYYVEAKWLHENYIPTMEEYMPIALLSCGYWNLTMSSFVGMEDSITKETFNWAFNDPKIVRASSTICRLMSDIVDHKVERERGHVSSAAECYMEQYGVSMQEAYDELYKQINNAWKDINEEFLKPTAAPTSALNRILNLARVIDLLYTGEDAYTQVGESAKTSITALLIDSIPI